MPLALNMAPDAMPEASLPTVTLLDPLLAKVPLAPLAGALNVTGTPATAVVSGQPFVLASATCRFAPNAVCSSAVCGLPPASDSALGGFEAGHAGLEVPLSPAAGTAPIASPAAASTRPVMRSAASQLGAHQEIAPFAGGETAARSRVARRCR